MLARLRPWLAPLLAVSANSPIAGGHETGWASWRYVIQSRWPTAVPPAAWPDAAAYDAAIRGLIGQGAALDERSVYFLARLSPRYPTVEVRVADVCLDAGTAVLLAGLTRALVATALAEARRGTPAPAPPARQVTAALAAAARHGLAGAGVDPVTGQAVDAAALRSRLLDHVYPALSDHGDTETVTMLLRRLDQRGTGADRQRALFTRAASTPAFITALARATLSGYEPGRWRGRCPGPGSGRRAVVRYPQWPQYAPAPGAGHEDTGSRPVAPARRGPRGTRCARHMLAGLGHLCAELATRQCDDGTREPGQRADGGCRAAAAGPGPRAGPDGDPGQAGAGDRRPGPGHLYRAEPLGRQRRDRGQPGLPAAAAGKDDPRDDPRHDGQQGSDQRSHRAAAPGPGLSRP